MHVDHAQLRELFPANEVGHLRLDDRLRSVVDRIRFRLAGFDLQGNPQDEECLMRDLKSISILNDAMVLKTEDLKIADNANIHDAIKKLKKKYSTKGWQATTMSVEKLKDEMLENDLFAFLFEHYSDKQKITPIGSQIGFPHMPKRPPNLAASTLEESEWFEAHFLEFFMIWRSNFIDVMTQEIEDELQSMGCDPDPELIGLRMQGLGCGTVTKRIDAIAGLTMEEITAHLPPEFRRHISDISYNTGRILYPGNPNESLYMGNPTSEGAGTEAGFHRTNALRKYFDWVPPVKIYWERWRGTPSEIERKTRDPEGPIAMKGGWNFPEIDAFGRLLARKIVDKAWSIFRKK